jgi:hypothetical protein
MRLRSPERNRSQSWRPEIDLDRIEVPICGQDQLPFVRRIADDRNSAITPLQRRDCGPRAGSDFSSATISAIGFASQSVPDIIAH